MLYYKDAKDKRYLSKFKTSRRLKNIKHFTVLGEETENKIMEWFDVQRTEGYVVTNRMIQQKARDTAIEKQIENFTASKGWLKGFKKRHNLVMRAVTQKKYKQEDVESSTISFIESIKKNFNIDLRRVFNADETMVFLQQNKRTNHYKGSDQVVAKYCKRGYLIGVTVLLCASAVGEKKKALIVLKLVKPLRDRDYEELNIPDNVSITNSKSGWMNQTLFGDWVDKNITRYDQLIIDKSPVHTGQSFRDSHSNHNFCFVPPGMTGVLQPLDLSVMSIFKQNIRKYVMENNYPVKSSFIQSHRQHMLNAVSYAWGRISTEDIIRGFRKAGIINALAPRT